MPLRAALKQSFQSFVAAAAQRLQNRSAVDGGRRGRSHVRIGRVTGECRKRAGSRFHRSSSSLSCPASSGTARCSAARSESSPSTSEPGKTVLDRGIPARAGSAVHSEQRPGTEREQIRGWQAEELVAAAHRIQAASAGRPCRLVTNGHRGLLLSSRVTPASIAHGLRMSSGGT